MAKIKVTELINRAKITAQDVDFVQWPESEWLTWYNECLLALASARSDAGAETRTVTLVAGSRQTIPSDSNKLIEVVRNDSTGRAIRLLDRKVLDEQNPLWHKETGPEPKYYTYDPNIPTTYYVFPGVTTTTHKIDVVIAKSPTPADSVESEVPVEDWFAPAIVDYILYRAYLKNAEYTNDLTRSEYFRRSFYERLGVESRISTGD
ncbi:hypothetical protein SAMN05660772_01837 [Pasteurella testudinis DSM 23072]|uniref:Uncharacterized protein n=1 Tax=Pasteurella testudinis DSM 23072 TaxID=1122938 RepID=A0A1W1UKZ0_9PAST|nr:DUF6682 family protein [Pasteurella testudinis]SMB81404.1 hypothetical protein SAMN05660772_01837 [Pasteurella testudinis DSM 23072]SUB51395.1 Uncharacterised protein [Pasteurella testudinis]